jgi:hypothetical protein
MLVPTLYSKLSERERNVWNSLKKISSARKLQICAVYLVLVECVNWLTSPRIGCEIDCCCACVECLWGWLLSSRAVFWRIGREIYFYVCLRFSGGYQFQCAGGHVRANQRQQIDRERESRARELFLSSFAGCCCGSHDAPSIKDPQAAAAVTPEYLCLCVLAHQILFRPHPRHQKKLYLIFRC